MEYLMNKRIKASNNTTEISIPSSIDLRITEGNN